MSGLWISPNSFQTFEDLDRTALLQELATSERVTGILGSTGAYGTLMPDPDPVLRKRGDDARILADLMADDQVTTVVQQRKLQTLNKKDYHFTPGKPRGGDPDEPAKAACDALLADVENLDMYNLIAELLDAPYYGNTIVELIWEPGDAGRYRLMDAIAKPREWFAYDENRRLCLYTCGSANYDPVPAGKFVTARHFPTYLNPYGVRLLSRVLWPVAFKKGGVEFWLHFAEKFGQPWVFGKARQGADQHERDAMAQALAAMVRDAVAVVSSGSDVTVAAPGKSSGDIHHKLVSYWDGAISKVITGQTLTSDVGEHGSYAASNTHYTVLEDFGEADQSLVCAVFNDLSWHYTRVNYGEHVYAPVFEYIKAQDMLAKAKLSNALKQAGVVFTKAYFEDEFDLAPEHFTVSKSPSLLPARTDGEPDKTTGSPPTPQAGAEYAESSAAELSDLAAHPLDDLEQGAIAEAEPLLEAMAGSLLDLAVKAESPEDAWLLLAEAAGEPEEEWTTSLGQAMQAAYLTGVADASEDSGDTGESDANGGGHAG